VELSGLTEREPVESDGFDELDPDARLLYDLIVDEVLPADALVGAASHPAWRVRAAVAAALGAPDELVTAAAADPHPLVRAAAVASGRLDTATLAVLAGDADHRVRVFVACARIDDETRARLRADGDPMVAGAASGTLTLGSSELDQAP
jgi:hypothetical protein